MGAKESCCVSTTQDSTYHPGPIANKISVSVAGGLQGSATPHLKSGRKPKRSIQDSAEKPEDPSPFSQPAPSMIAPLSQTQNKPKKVSSPQNFRAYAAQTNSRIPAGGSGQSLNLRIKSHKTAKSYLTEGEEKNGSGMVPSEKHNSTTIEGLGTPYEIGKPTFIDRMKSPSHAEGKKSKKGGASKSPKGDLLNVQPVEQERDSVPSLVEEVEEPNSSVKIPTGQEANDTSQGSIMKSPIAPTPAMKIKKARKASILNVMGNLKAIE